MILLKGRTINLRPMKREDIFLIEQWFLKNNLAVRFLGTRLASIDNFRKFFEDGLSNPQNRRDFIIETKSGKSIGAVSLENINWKDRIADTVIFLGEKGFREKKYIYDAYLEMYNFAFNILNLNRVQMTFLGFNNIMVRVVQQWLEESLEDSTLYPLVKEGILRKATFFNGKYYDIYIYGVLKEEYNRVKEKFLRHFYAKYMG